MSQHLNLQLLKDGLLLSHSMKIKTVCTFLVDFLLLLQYNGSAKSTSILPKAWASLTLNSGRCVIFVRLYGFTSNVLQVRHFLITFVANSCPFVT